MCRSRAVAVLSVLLLLQSVVAFVSAKRSSSSPIPWKTLSGDAPLVIARGGFSGLFPDSSSLAYRWALLTSLSNVILWCDVQLTKDGAGICFPDLKLDNASDISHVLSKKDTTYLVNGVPTQGWFSIDFTLNDLTDVSLIQGIYSRTSVFDGNLLQILTVQDIVKGLGPPGLWLNIQHDAFFSQHNLSMRSFVLSTSRSVTVNYISSPEVSFLRSILARFRRSRTKLVFRFLGKNEVEPSTNQTYGFLSKNLTFIKTFASGILVPKVYIWPVDESLYLLPHTSIVLDAHKEGLEVYGSDFANDVPSSYNYSYDAVAEYLSFVDNGGFSVDGVLSDFPLTPSAAIDCFSHLGEKASGQKNPLVISKDGASGDYPGCTDLAYKKAISGGVDVLDCSVQMAKDGTPFCLSSINLIDSTAVAQSSFSNRTTTIAEITTGSGIFTFNLTWDEIKTLTPSISNPYRKYDLYRNPKFKNSGKFLTLSDFLALTKNTSSLAGVLINIEHAAYLAEKQGLSVTDAVLDALSKAGYNNQTTQKVMIQSSNSSVLMKFKDKNNYELVYKVDEAIRDVLNSTIENIKKFADSVVISKTSVFPKNQGFITGATSITSKLQSYKLPVYVETFSNEFVSQAWDFFSDSTAEINSYVLGAEINGIITDFPKTAVSYKRNRCLNSDKEPPIYMSPVEPGGLIKLVTSQQLLPPAEAPNPVLTEPDVLEPPLPSVSDTKSSSSGSESAGAPTSANGQPQIATASIFLSNLSMLIMTLFLVLKQ